MLLFSSNALHNSYSCVSLCFHRWLKEGRDGLYRPVPTYWEEAGSCLLPVRTQHITADKGGRRCEDGWKLLTLPSRILDAELHE